LGRYERRCLILNHSTRRHRKYQIHHEIQRPCNLIRIHSNYLLHKLQPTLPSQKTPPTLLILNVNSLAKPKAIEQLEIELFGYNIEIAIISETHLKSKHLESLIQIPGYTIFRKDRKDRKGGGVAIITRNHLKAQPHQPIESNKDFELLWITTEKSGQI